VWRVAVGGVHGDERRVPREGVLRDGLDAVAMETTGQETPRKPN